MADIARRGGKSQALPSLQIDSTAAVKALSSGRNSSGSSAAWASPRTSANSHAANRVSPAASQGKLSARSPSMASLGRSGTKRSGSFAVSSSIVTRAALEMAAKQGLVTSGSKKAMTNLSQEDQVRLILGLRPGATSTRFFAYRLTQMQWFEYTILAFIIINCVVLALQTPAVDAARANGEPHSTKVLADALVVIDLVILLVFTTEMFVKVYGWGPKVYLTDGWSRLDLLCVLSGWVSFVLDSAGSGVTVKLTAFRALRALRPLRALKFFTRVRMIVDTGIRSFVLVADTALLLVFCVVLFGIVGVQFFGDRLRYRCVDGDSGLPPEYFTKFCSESAEAGSKASCPESLECRNIGLPNGGLLGFDHIGLASLTMLRTLTLDRWYEEMYALEQTGLRWVWLYFVLLIFVLTYLVLNLFTAVVVATFGKIRVEYADQFDIDDYDSAYSFDDNEYDDDDAIEGDDGGISVLQSFNARMASSDANPDSVTPQQAEVGSVTNITESANISKENISSVNVDEEKETKTLPGDTTGKVDDALPPIDAPVPPLGESTRPQASGQTDLDKCAGAVTTDPKPDSKILPGQKKAIQEKSALDSSFTLSENVLLPVQSKAQESASNKEHPQQHLPTDDLFSLRKRRVSSVTMLCRRLSKSKSFQALSTAVIICNLGTMAMVFDYGDGMPESITNVTFVLEWIFVVFFTGELLVNVFSYSPAHKFFYRGFNVFEFIVVILSLVALPLPFMPNVSFLRIFKVFRAMQSMRLVQRLPELHMLLLTVFQSAEILFSLLGVIVFDIFLFSLLGMQLFGGEFGEGVSRPRYHFDDFPTAMLTLFVVMTQEDWMDVLYAALKSPRSSWAAVPFFLLYVVVSVYILLNLFVAVILENFVLEDQEKIKKQEAHYKKALKGKDDTTITSMLAAVWALRKLSSTAQKVVPLTEELVASSSNDGSGSESRILSSDGKVFPEPMSLNSKSGSATSSGPGTQVGSAINTSTAFETNGIGTHGEKSSLSEGAKMAQVNLSGQHLSPIGEESLTALEGGMFLSRTASEEPDMDSTMGKNVSSAENKTIAAIARTMSNSPKSDTSSKGLRGLGSTVHDLRDLMSSMGISQDGVDLSDKAAAAQLAIIDAAKDIWCFPSTILFRRVSHAIVTNKWFDRLILFVIAASSITLAIDSPSIRGTSLSEDLKILDIVFFGIFVGEFVVKALAFGWIGYYADGWNRLDFIVLVFTALNFVPSLDLSWGRVLRIGRTLRPLRVMNKNQEMKHVVNALLGSMKGIGNVVVFAVMVMALYGLLGIDLFAGQLFRCNPDISRSKQDCFGHTELYGFAIPSVWDHPISNFNDLSEALFTLFEVSTLENWIGVMYSVIDSTGRDTAPKENYAPERALFFVTYIFIATFFTSNLFIGVLVDHFRQASGSAFLTNSQRLWMDMKRLTVLLRPEHIPKRPENKFRRFLWKGVTSPWFESVILGCIVVNVGFMTTEHANMSQTWTDILFFVNITFLAIFTLEMIVKVMALGPRGYLRDMWNLFDMIVCIGSIVLLSINTGSANSAQVARAFRVLRLVRIVKRAKGIRLVFNTLLLSIPALANIASLFFLLFFIFAVIGMTTFGDLSDGNYINSSNHLRDWGTSMMLLFRVTTEFSTELISQASISQPKCTINTSLGITDCGNPVIARIVFTMFMLLGAYILLNVFVAAILENFSVCSVEDSEGIDFEWQHFEQFKSVWMLFDPQASGAIPIGRLRGFLEFLGAPLGRKPATGIWYRVILADLSAHQFMHSTSNGQPHAMVSFRQVLLSLCLHQAGPAILTYSEMHNREKFVASLKEDAAASVIQDLARRYVYRRAALKKLACFIINGRVKAYWRRQKFKKLARVFNLPTLFRSPKAGSGRVPDLTAGDDGNHGAHMDESTAEKVYAQLANVSELAVSSSVGQDKHHGGFAPQDVPEPALVSSSSSASVQMVATPGNADAEPSDDALDQEVQSHVGGGNEGQGDVLPPSIIKNSGEAVSDSPLPVEQL